MISQKVYTSLTPYNFKYGFSRKKMLERMRVAQENILNKIWKKNPNFLF